MKIKIIFFTIFNSFFLFSQVETKTQKIVKILELQSFYLNGGTKSVMGGNSRVGFKIDLPPNTVEWYYAFTTEPNKNIEDNLQLESQLGFVLNTAGFSNNLINLIKIPKGQGLIDIYLTDRKGYDIFFEKDFFGVWKYTSPNHSIEGSRSNVKDGKVKIDDIKNGSHFLVIRNTSATTGINVKLEVVAIVEEKGIDLSTWDKKTKDVLFNNIKTELKKSNSFLGNEKVEDISACIMANITSNLKPIDFKNLAEYELKALLKNYEETCNP